ncbi:MAG: hypothetical protein M9932_09270 [Xanthobacteraceae bacterium]|nr:hypothetical protein [Xanthobacteraceae bacterium]
MVGGTVRGVAMRLRDAAIAGLCGMAAQSGLMAARRALGILPAFQPYADLQRLLSGMVAASLAHDLSWLLPMISGALVWSSIFAWAYARIPARTALGKGALVTVFAWALTGLAIMPALGHGLFAARAGAGAGPALMMLAMLATYCLTLSLVYGRLRRSQG